MNSEKRMSTNNKSQGVRALVEPLAIDSRLSDGDLSALSLHSSEQYSNNEFEALASMQAEFECMNAEEVMTTDEEHMGLEQSIESETIVPDVEMTDAPSEVQTEELCYTTTTTTNQNNQNIVFQTKPTLQRVPVSAIQVILSLINSH